MEKWEYKVVAHKETPALKNFGNKFSKLEDFLNDMGNQGWDLVTSGAVGSNYTFIFKRIR